MTTCEFYSALKAKFPKSFNDGKEEFKGIPDDERAIFDAMIARQRERVRKKQENA